MEQPDLVCLHPMGDYRLFGDEQTLLLDHLLPSRLYDMCEYHLLDDLQGLFEYESDALLFMWYCGSVGSLWMLPSLVHQLA